MTAIKNRKGVFKITSVTHDYFMQTVNQPKIPPYQKINQFQQKEKNILFELQIYKDAKEKELMEDDFDEEEFLNKVSKDLQSAYDKPFRSNLIATNVVSVVVTQKKP